MVADDDLRAMPREVVPAVQVHTCLSRVFAPTHLGDMAGRVWSPDQLQMRPDNARATRLGNITRAHIVFAGSWHFGRAPLFALEQVALVRLVGARKNVCSAD